jgi:hypothetical protein
LGSCKVLWSGLVAEAEVSDGRRYVVLWGRRHRDPRVDIVRGLRGWSGGGREALYLGVYIMEN